MYHMNITSALVKNAKARVARHKERRMGTAKKKVLLLLFGGLSLGLSGSPRTSWKIIGEMAREWEELTRQASERAVNSLYASKLVGVRENADGTFTLILSEKGKNKALTYDLARMKIEVPSKWDEQWRMVSFDIPVDKKDVRDSLRGHLLRLGFFEMHQSFFTYPFECRKEVEYIVELYDARKYVRFIVATDVDNELHLKKFFKME